MPAGDITRHINIILNTIYKKTGIDKFAVGSMAARRTIKKLADTSNVAYSQMAGSMQKANIGINKTGRLFDLATGKGMKFREGVRRLKMANQRFHMELLSVMFAGMALQKAMKGLLDPTRKLTGELDLMSNTLALFFLPYAKDSLGITVALQKAFLNLNKITGGLAGRVAGWGAAFLEATGGLIMMVGQLGLAINGFSLLYEKSETFRKLSDIVLKFTRTGWNLVTGAFSTLKEWGLKTVKTITRTIKSVFSMEGWSEAGGLKSVIAKINASKAMKIMVFIGASLIAFEIGKQIGTRLRGTGIMEQIMGAFVPGGKFLFDVKAPGKTWWETLTGLEGITVPFQRGGIVTRPTLGMIGEAGPEAIIPLNRANEYLNFSPTINITATSNVDIGLMKSQLNEEWYSELKSGGLR